MNPKDRKEILFMGKITASISHEMQNVMAIINESIGLMEDMLKMSEDIPDMYQQKLQNILATIQNQIQRGIDIAFQLNRFAHESEESRKEIYLADMIEHFVILTKRFAKLQKVSLECGMTDRNHKIIAHPVLILMAFFTGLECCLPQVPEGGRIVYHSAKKDGGYAVHMVCEAPQSKDAAFIRDVSESDSWISLQEIMTEMGGKAHVDENGRGVIIGFQKKSL